MANFHTHLTVAALGSMAATAICIQKIGLSDAQAVTLFFLGMVAGLLPDIDSDDSIPARWIFRSVNALVVFAVGWVSYERFPHLQWILMVATTWGVMHWVIIRAFKAFTNHRGLIHSVPAAGLVGITIFHLGVQLAAWPTPFAWLAAAFATGGYLLHLALDELFSVDLLGRSLKQSFGTAMTLVVWRSWRAYLTLYALLGVATLYAFERVS